MQIVESVARMKEVAKEARASGRRLGFVPTMGYLHEGHRALIRAARERADWVAVSIFVNPTQFGPAEDLSRYPRDFPRDTELCRSAEVDALFAPSAAEMYPTGFQTCVDVEELSKPLCGAVRPGHFRGVATVVAKLFHVVGPDVAVFGEKDYQQLQVIRRLVRDLSMDVEIVSVPTVREADGLALSSRNAYLSQEERARALSLSRALGRAEELVRAGEREAGAILLEVSEILRAARGEVEYAELRHPESLAPVQELTEPAVLALAVRIGRTRLIDNRILGARADDRGGTLP
jgi:pantoate--beta-alanine ligase